MKYLKKLDVPNFDNGTTSNVIIYNNRIEAVTSSSQGRKKRIPSYTKKLSKDLYVDVTTGEVKSYKHSSTKSEQAIRATEKKLSRLINANFDSDTRGIHITLTYKEQLFDTDILSKDITAFFKDFRKAYPDIAYIWIAEPHKSGAWHIHILAKYTNNVYIFIPFENIASIWGKGIVKVVKLQRRDDIAGYFTRKFKDKSIIGFYPSGFRCYGYSRKTITVPKPVRMTRDELAEFTESSGFERISDDTYGLYPDESMTGTPLCINRYQIFVKKKKYKGTKRA